MPDVKIAVIGAGHMGAFHMNLLHKQNISRAVCCGFFEPRSERAAEMEKRFGLRRLSSLEETADLADAVIIATPTHEHYNLSKFFLARGKHVLVEKPFAEKYQEAEELVNIATQKNIQLHVGHIERFNGAVQELSKISVNPHLVEAQRIGPNPGRILDVGVTLDLMIHDIDIVYNLVKSEVVDLTAYGRFISSKQHEDIAVVSLAFANGSIANIIASRVSQYKARTLTVHQDDLYLTLDYTDQEIHIHRHASSFSLPQNDEIRYSSESVVERLFVHKDNPLKLEQQHYVDCILGLCKPHVDGDADIKILKITNEIVAAIQKKHFSA